MKKLLPLLIVLYSFSLKAQVPISVDSSDYGSPGDTVVLANDFSPANVTVGGAAFQNWDFTMLKVESLDTVHFYDPASTANGADFPGSNVAMLSTADDLMFYIKKSDTELHFDGLFGDFSGMGVVAKLNFDPDLKTMEFPSTYLDAFQDQAQVDTTLEDVFTGQADSIRFKRDVSVDSEIDAYGSVTTPAGTYDCIRQYSEEITFDTIWAGVDTFGFFVWNVVQTTIDTNYSYSWIANGEDLPVVSVQADGPGGNIISANFKVGSRVTAAIQSVSPVSCFGGSDGEAVVEGISGVSSYSYLWPASANSATTSSVAGLTAGSYVVTVTDNLNDEALATVIIEEPIAVSVTANVTSDVSCKGGSDGSASAMGSGGSAPYNYTWPSGAGGINNISLSAGLHTVTVTDFNGCQSTTSITVTEPTTLFTASIVSSTNVSCGGCTDGSATVEGSGGDTPYTYQWSNGQNSATATGLSAATHSVNVTDANGCVRIESVNIQPSSTGDLTDKGNRITIFPNPASEVFTIQSETTIRSIEFTNIMGELINTWYDLNSSNISLDLSGFAEGIYLLHVKTDSGIQYRKVQVIR